MDNTDAYIVCLYNRILKEQETVKPCTTLTTGYKP